MDTSTLKELIAKNKLDDVLDILLEHYKHSKDDLHKQVISVASRYNRHKSNARKGIESKEIPQIISDVLDIIDTIERKEGEEEKKVIDSISSLTERSLEPTEETAKNTGEQSSFFEKFSSALIVFGVFAILFCIGLYSGRQSRDFSDEEFYKRYIFSKLKITSDSETNQYFLVYQCGGKDFYYYNVDRNEILDENFMQGPGKSGNNFKIEINLEEVIGLSATSSLFLYDGFSAYVKRPFKMGGNIKTKIFFALGLLSTYGIGKWLGARKIPSCNSPAITNQLEDPAVWNKYERYMYNFANNMMVLGVNNYPINTMANCPLFLLIDSTKLDTVTYSEFKKIENKYLEDRGKIRTTNHDISSEELSRFFTRTNILFNEYNTGNHLTTTGKTWKFYNYQIYNRGYSIQDYNYLFDEFVQKFQ